MSTMSQIKDIIYDTFAAKGKCTLEEIKNTAAEMGVVIPEESTLIRTTMYQLAKKDMRIERVGRGIYHFVEKKEIDEKKDLKEVDCETIEYLNETGKRIAAIIDDLKKINWFQSSDIDVSRARSIGICLKKFHEDFEKKINELSL